MYVSGKNRNGRQNHHLSMVIIIFILYYDIYIYEKVQKYKYLERKVMYVGGKNRNGHQHHHLSMVRV
jgi:hypothetical protein